MDKKERLALLLAQQSATDAGQVQTVLHYLYFEDKKSARLAETLIRELRLQVEMRRAADDSSWLVLVSQSMVPSEAAVGAAHSVLEDIAGECEGEYDGWEIEVE